MTLTAAMADFSVKVFGRRCDLDRMTSIGARRMRQGRYTEGRRWLIRAALVGHDVACVWMGVADYEGFGSEKNYARAFVWMRQGAAHDHPNGLHHLALCHKYGIGTTINRQKAASLLLLAARQGHKKSQLELARLLTAGWPGTKPDWAMAAYWRGQARDKTAFRPY